MFSYKGTANTAVIFISDKIRRTFHYPHAITESIRYNIVSIQYEEDKEMTTKKLIQAIAADALGTTFQEEMRNIYQKEADSGTFGAEERDYSNAMYVLCEALAPEKLIVLTEYEDTCAKIREFSASYGFIAGLCCGFRQYFTLDDEDDGGFMKYVANDIWLIPKMKRHAEHYANIKRRDKAGQALLDGESKEIQEHIVSVECAWSQRAYSASISGFYCGYRAAVAILDRIEPYSGCSVKMTARILSMEHRLGYIESFEEIERRTACDIFC